MKKKIIIAVCSILVISLIVFAVISRNKAMEVTTSLVVIGDLTEYVEELAEVKLENQSNIFSSVSGRVNEVFIDIGDEVKAGDLLLTIDKQSLLTQIGILEENKTLLSSQYRDFLELNNREIEKIRMQIPVLESNVREAERAADNSKQLHEAGAISQQEYQLSLNRLKAEQSHLSSVYLDLETLKNSGGRATQFESQVRQIDMQISELRNKFEDFNILSPINGTVIYKGVEIGSFLQPGILLMGIGNKGELFLESDILVGEIVNVHENSQVKIYSRDLGIEGASGFISKIHPQAISKVSDLGIQQKRVTVEATITDTIENLRPGYNLDMKIIVNRRDNILIIPKNSVFKLDGQDHVFVNENNRAVLREVELGMEAQRLVEVINGLKEGEEVIVSPNENLNEGTQIKSTR